MPGTGGGREPRPLVRAARTGNTGRGAGSRRSARPPIGPVKGEGAGSGEAGCSFDGDRTGGEHFKDGAGPVEGGRPRTCSRSGTKYGRGRSAPPEPVGTAPAPPARAPAPAAPPAAPPTAPAPAAPPPGPAAPVPPVRAPPGPVAPEPQAVEPRASEA
ncbi:unnamed protein product [Closterium sp. NIES-54]